MSLSSQADMCINKFLFMSFHINRLNKIMPYTSKKTSNRTEISVNVIHFIMYNS